MNAPVPDSAPAVVPGLGAVVLCGGESSRMGRPKAWLPFGGEPLLVRVVRRVAEAASPVVVVAAPGQVLPPLPPEVRVVRDAVSGQGPLQGLLAGLEALADLATAAFACATDAPFLCPALVRRLETLRREGDHDAAVPRAHGHVHPLAAVYRVTVREAVRELLDRHVRRVLSLLDGIDARLCDEADLLADNTLCAADPQLRSLHNINTPADHERASKELEGDGG